MRGRGEVNLKAPDGIHFQPFAVEASSVALGTVQRLIPAVARRGLPAPRSGSAFAGLDRITDAVLRPPGDRWSAAAYEFTIEPEAVGRGR